MCIYLNHSYEYWLIAGGWEIVGYRLFAFLSQLETTALASLVVQLCATPEIDANSRLYLGIRVVLWIELLLRGGWCIWLVCTRVKNAHELNR